MLNEIEVLKKAEVSIEIPTYNESENLPGLIEEIENLGINCEIIVIDDNSPDGTASVADDLAKIYPNIKVVRRAKKSGISSAVQDGLEVAEGNIIVVMDADHQHPPSTIKNLYSKIKEGNDIVVASRYVSGGGAEKFSFFRKLTSKVATALAHVMLRETKLITDPLSGFFAFRKDVVKGADIGSNGYKILLEILVKGNGKNLVEVPYTFGTRTNGKSKLTVGENFRYLELVMKLSGYRPLKFFLVGLSGVAVNEGLLFLLHSSYGLTTAMAGLVAIEVSILSNFVANNLWTFRQRRIGSLIGRAAKYNLVTLGGAAINYVTLLGLVFLGVHYLFSNLIGIALGFAANYLGSEFLVWSKIKG